MSFRLPQFKARELRELIVRAGFEPVYQDSSHLYFRNHSTGRSTSIPIHGGRDIGRGLAHKILFTDCELTRSQVQNLLNH